MKKPVCLKDIRQRLATGTYTGPEGFYAVRGSRAAGVSPPPAGVHAPRALQLKLRVSAAGLAQMGAKLTIYVPEKNHLPTRRRHPRSPMSTGPLGPLLCRTWTSWCTTACCTTPWALTCAPWARKSSSAGRTTGGATRCSTSSRWGLRPPCRALLLPALVLKRRSLGCTCWRGAAQQDAARERPTPVDTLPAF